MGEESIKSIKSRTQKGVTLNGYLPIKWMAPNKYCQTFFVHWSGQVYYSIT